MSASATIILGLVELTTPVAIAFVLTSLVTLVSALEPFFNFRARWVLLEEGQYKFHRIRDDIDFALVARNGQLEAAEAEGFHQRMNDTWTYMSESWLSERRRGSGSSGGSSAS